MTLLERNPAVVLHEIEGEGFLVEPSGGEIFHLDALTGRIWHLLERPCPAVEVAATLAGAAASGSRGELERLLAELVSAGVLASRSR